MDLRTDISLRPATVAERRAVYEWMAESDVTSMMAGPPMFPEIPVPSFDDFCADYTNCFFDGAINEAGCSFLIETAASPEPVGHVSYSQCNLANRHTELDIWLAGTKHCGRGIGTAALGLLVDLLQRELNLSRFLIRPSRRNPRAIESYRKCGFAETTETEELLAFFGPGEFTDTVTMIRDVTTESS